MASNKEFKRTDGDLFIEALEMLWNEYKRKPRKKRMDFSASLRSASRYAKKKGFREIVLTAAREIEKDCFGVSTIEADTEPTAQFLPETYCFEIEVLQ